MSNIKFYPEVENSNISGTPCPHINGNWVGSRSCMNCKFFNGMTTESVDCKMCSKDTDIKFIGVKISVDNEPVFVIGNDGKCVFNSETSVKRADKHCKIIMMEI